MAELSNMFDCIVVTQVAKNEIEEILMGKMTIKSEAKKILRQNLSFKTPIFLFYEQKRIDISRFITFSFLVYRKG